jgi:predicted solute-binding protein
MYVNELTLEYGERGRTAVQRLFDEAWEKRLIPKQITAEFSA